MSLALEVLKTAVWPAFGIFVLTFVPWGKIISLGRRKRE